MSTLKIQKDTPLAPLTTFRIGGNALVYVQVESVSEIVEAIEYAKHHQIPALLLGGGSNILFSDKGFPGIVIHIVGTASTLSHQKLTASAGANLLDVILSLEEVGLAGMERLSGIPGTLGGAVRGNAGAFGSEISEFLVSVTAVNLRTGIVKNFTKDECQFGYRESFFKKEKDWAIVNAEFFLTTTAPSEHLATIRKETMAARESKHPQDAWCAGSFFMNPAVRNQELLDEFQKDNGYPTKNGKLPAGWLIDHVGLRGKKIGGAQVSPHHPNYIINTGNATASDVVMLASLIKTRVRDELGVRLQEEIQIVGF
jgi:UDP-N-acetylmuramate dehydrogenase